MRMNQRFMPPSPGPLRPILCNALLEKIKAGKEVYSHGRKIAEDKGIINRFGVPIVDLIEHALVDKKTDYISSEALEKLRDIGEDLIERDQKVCCIAIKRFSKKDHKLEGFLVALDQRIMITKMIENLEHFKRTGHMPTIPEDKKI